MNRDAHLVRSTTNEQLFRALVDIKSAHRDWAITVLFYAALHALDAFLHGKGIPDKDIASHHDRPAPLATTEASFTKFVDAWTRVLKPFLFATGPVKSP
nr:hypothetical protein [Candidatus Sigynarchaeota archaeon]